MPLWEAFTTRWVICCVLVPSVLRTMPACAYLPAISTYTFLCIAVTFLLLTGCPACHCCHHGFSPAQPALRSGTLLRHSTCTISASCILPVLFLPSTLSLCCSVCLQKAWPIGYTIFFLTSLLLYLLLLSCCLRYGPSLAFVILRHRCLHHSCVSCYKSYPSLACARFCSLWRWDIHVILFFLLWS